MTPADPLHNFDLSSAMHMPDNEWNVPDWKRPGEYPDEHTEDWEWRWEFIRRHKFYRECWQRYQREPEDWNRRRCNGRSRIEELTRRLLLPRLPHPSRRHDTHYFRIVMARPFCDVMPAMSDMTDFCAEAAMKGQYLAAITPTKNLDGQWQEIKAKIAHLSKEWQGTSEIRDEKPNRTKFPLYLRVIDAQDKNISLLKISTILNNEPLHQVINERTVGHICYAARELQKHLLFEELPIPVKKKQKKA